jgi:hypothetical protein
MPGENIDSQAQSAVVLEVLQRPDGVPMTQVFGTITDVDNQRASQPRLTACMRSA